MSSNSPLHSRYNRPFAKNNLYRKTSLKSSNKRLLPVFNSIYSFVPTNLETKYEKLLSGVQAQVMRYKRSGLLN